MPIPQENLNRLDEAIDRCLTKRDRDTDPKQFSEGAPQQPLNDSPPEMPKANLWGGKPPIPIEHL
jgi:hypothetical protein